MTIGEGLDKNDVGEQPDYWAELTSWLHSFTPAINDYLRTELNYKTDIKYNMFGPVHPWDRSNDNTGENLRQAMAQNLRSSWGGGSFDRVIEMNIRERIQDSGTNSIKNARGGQGD